ncbi:hypothetical protein KI688_004603 [Linnemannia hyalina]|uniref:UBA domain-containing protein n=1 Tax=Linnemannia hyalina TaxID=64524 RepID=A0A9P7XM25_9FUNG|nr:hypothetical protein KI688_004603 [Linnemannia hyalina]
MDDLLGLSWEQKGSANNNNNRQGANGAGMASGKVKPVPPPPTSKPAHLQMGLSKVGLVPTPASSNSLPAPQPYRNNTTGISSSPASSQKKNADDVFGSLMSSFGQNTSSGAAKSLNAMSLDERRRHDQQQQSNSWGSQSSSPTPASSASPFGSSSFNSSSSPGFSQPSRSAFSPAMNTSSSTIPRGYDPGNIAGLQRPIATSSPQPVPGFASPIPKFPQSQPLSSQQQQQFNLSRNQSPAGGYLASPGVLGRSLSPAMTPLQPERSNNSSPSTMASTPTSKDPFGALLGDQVSRNSPSMKNQSLNSIRNNTPPLGQPSATKVADPWDLDFLASATVAKPAQTPVSSNDVFDLGSFESAPPENSSRQRDSVDALNSFIGKQPSPAGSPSQRTSPPTSRTPAAKPPRSATTTSKPASREDADIAQIVSMGFSAERARLALAMTENGRDIEAAIEYLVQNDEAEDQMPSRRRNQGARERGQEERRPYRDDSDPALEDRRRRNQGRGQTQQQQELSRAQQLQQQKDKLVGTASVFGMSVLSKANEFYKQGRDKVQSVMEDMTTEEPKSTAARRHQWVEDEFKSSRSQYKDSDSEEDEVYRGRREQQRQQEQRQQQQQQQQSSRPRQEKEAFEDTYVSSSRRGGATASRNQQPLFSMDDSPNKQKSNMSTPKFSSSSKSSTPSNASRAAKAPSPLPPKPARPPRTLVQASSQQLAESNHHKEKGNEVFKLGQFGQAAEFYARAGQSLPSGHILLIVTQNNRAAALLKIGEYRETVSVCDKTVLQVQGPDGQGVQDILPESAGVNLKDQMGKALMRRATAYENLEKYKEARDDWAKLKEMDPGHRNATEGQRRCEKAIAMVNGGGANGFAQPIARKPAVSAARQGGMSVSSPMQDMFSSQQRTNNDAKVKAELARSEGVGKLRQNAAQQERDEDEKLRLTDQVEMKMTMWKAGKEDNIRALISSLGSVLWEGVGWKPVGLHELVTPSQVKIKYMRAIGKMHPDKLSGSTTIEQRMMANTIFSTLNSAWDAFKVQNNM